MSETAYLALLLDAPLQSWGFASHFQRRTTGLHPTKSGVIGLICAAMGLAKGSPEERVAIHKLGELKMTSIAMPRHHVRRLEDYHTVGAAYDPEDSWERLHITRKASSTPEKLALNVKNGVAVAVVTRRQYLLDARFGVIFAGERPLLEEVAAALQDPVWGVWLGRKSCIPAEPLFRGLCGTFAEAQKTLIGDTPLEAFTRVADAPTFAGGTDSYNDVPISFGRTDSSSEGRAFALRRVNVEVGITAEPGGEPQ